MNKMIWTTDTPKTSGYYWWRLGSHKKTYMTFVMNLKKGPKLVQLIDTDEGIIKYRFLEEMNGEWSECIDRPLDLFDKAVDTEKVKETDDTSVLVIPKIKDSYGVIPDEETNASKWRDVSKDTLKNQI